MLATWPQRTIFSLPLGSPPEPSPHLLSASSILAQSFLPGCVFKPFRGKKKWMRRKHRGLFISFFFSSLLGFLWCGWTFGREKPFCTLIVPSLFHGSSWRFLYGQSECFIFLASFTFLRKSSLVLDKSKALKKYMLIAYLIKRKKKHWKITNSFLKMYFKMQKCLELPWQSIGYDLAPGQGTTIPGATLPSQKKKSMKTFAIVISSKYSCLF